MDNVKVFVKKSNVEQGYSQGLDIEKVEIDGVNVTRGVKEITWKTSTGSIDEVTITFVGNVEIQTG